MAVLSKINQKKECGSVFIYILMAIALFAALTYAISNNKGGNTNIFTEEQAKIAAQELIEYGNTMAKTVQKLRLRGCQETQISFENNNVSGYTNGTNPTCQVFNQQGGNINFPAFGDTTYDANAPALDSISFNADNHIINIGSAEAELIAYVSGIRQNVCEEINQIVHGNGTAFTGGDITVGSTKFTGTYAGAPDTICSASADATNTGCCQETSGCNGGACYHFYQVLIPR